MFKYLLQLTNRYTIVRGMISYGLLWPCGSLIEQALIEKRTFQTMDWMKCLRFSVFGFCCLGPAMYGWVRLANVMWPRADLKSSLCKAYAEQAAYDPFAIAAFLFIITLMEGKSYEDGIREVKLKFFDTFKVGFIYWPCVQTLNFAYIPPKNQVVVTSFFSMCWTTFLAYVKNMEINSKEDDENHMSIYKSVSCKN